MASERDLELLDDYISNRLTGADKEYIEKKLEQDPDLRSEYSIQQQIAAGLRKARAAELKQLLNNIPVPPANGPASMLTKIAGAVIVTLVALSVAYYFWQAEPMVAPSRPAAEVPSAESIPPVTPTEENQPTSDIDTDIPEQQPETNTVAGNNDETVNKPDATDGKTSRINVFDPATEQESEEPVIPKGNTPATPEATMKASEMVVETDNTNKKYSFHYQMKDGKLILYGSFEKNFYEILEFIASEKRTVFLFYRDTYYLLRSDDDKITPLVPVDDRELLSKLRQYRASAR